MPNGDAKTEQKLQWKLRTGPKSAFFAYNATAQNIKQLFWVISNVLVIPLLRLPENFSYMQKYTVHHSAIDNCKLQ